MLYKRIFYRYPSVAVSVMGAKCTTVIKETVSDQLVVNLETYYAR